MALGVVLCSPDGTRHTFARTCGQRGCSNEAEARALIAGLEAARALGVTELSVASDCDVIVQHVSGRRTTRVRRLAVLFERAQQLLGEFSRAELRLVQRRHNGEADALARSALGLPPKSLA